MEVEIRWTPEALKGLKNTVDYLEQKWTTREIETFYQNIIAFIARIKLNPYLYPSMEANEKMRKGLIDKNNYVIYRIQKDEHCIELITLRSTKQQDEDVI